MWKDYSKSYLKNNKAAGTTVMTAALIASLFLSLLCSMFYNLWIYDIENISLEEGEWHGRILEDITQEELSIIKQFANVESAVIHKGASADKTITDICFINPRTIYRDMPLIAAKLGLKEEAVTYHEVLLSKYFIKDPQDEEPPMLLAFYAVILLVVSCSLLFIISSAFELSMSARIHQLGILSSIGATPLQIRICLLQEAAVLCTVPILAGSLLGTGISAGVIAAVNQFASQVKGRHLAVFQYEFFVFAATILITVFVVLLSAWIPARKLSCMTPLQAIRGADSLMLQKKRKAVILPRLFGITGEVAGNALKAQKKALRVSTISLTLSFLAFSVMLCFFTLSGISTRYTYFERYQDQWDVMITIKNKNLEAFPFLKEVRTLLEVRDTIAYQKAETMCLVPEALLSEELKEIGGMEAVTGGAVEKVGDYVKVKSPVMILDDESFLAYCNKLGLHPNLKGTIRYNQIWDSTNSNFREPKYIPFLSEISSMSILLGAEEKKVEIPVLGYAKELPALREEYAKFGLVHFMPLSLWETISGEMEELDSSVYLRILAMDPLDHDALHALEETVTSLIGPDYEIESENRIMEKKANDEMIKGSTMIMGAFCTLLAIIGIANVFSNTLGFLRQRRKEFAQYLSIGFTPLEMRKVFVLEATVIAGRPILSALSLTVGAVVFMITASHLEPNVFLAEAPVVPISLFALFIIGFVSLAYYIGGRRVLQCDLSESLRNDTVN